jgi:hypothetical protein
MDKKNVALYIGCSYVQLEIKNYNLANTAFLVIIYPCAKCSNGIYVYLYRNKQSIMTFIREFEENLLFLLDQERITINIYIIPRDCKNLIFRGE